MKELMEASAAMIQKGFHIEFMKISSPGNRLIYTDADKGLRDFSIIALTFLFSIMLHLSVNMIHFSTLYGKKNSHFCRNLIK